MYNHTSSFDDVVKFSAVAGAHSAHAHNKTNHSIDVFDKSNSVVRSGAVDVFEEFLAEQLEKALEREWELPGENHFSEAWMVLRESMIN